MPAIFVSVQVILKLYGSLPYFSGPYYYIILVSQICYFKRFFS